MTKMAPMSKDFAEKVTHLGGTSPYALTCEYPPPRGHCLRAGLESVINVVNHLCHQYLVSAPGRGLLKNKDDTIRKVATGL